MPGVGEGLAFLRKQQERMGSNQSRLLKLWLKDGERALFWWLSDGDDVAVPMIHLVPSAGNGGRVFTRDVLCQKVDQDDETYCALCERARQDREAGVKGGVSFSWPRLVAYTYVTSIFHPKQRTDGKGEQWEGVRSGEQVAFKETVNAVRLLVAKPRLQQQVLDAYAGDPSDEDFVSRKQTLLDRPYQLIRTGSGSQVNETLRPGKIAPMPDEIRKVMEELEPLRDVVVRDFGDRSKTAQSTTVPRSSGGGGGGYEPASAPIDDDELAELSELESF